MQLSWEKWLAEARLLVCSCWGFTLQILGGSEVLAVFVLSEEVVYVPAPRRREARDASIKDISKPQHSKVKVLGQLCRAQPQLVKSTET